MEEIADETLMIQVQHNELDKLVTLYDRYQRPLYNFFLKLCYDEDLAKDLVQNLFMRVIKYKKTYKPEHKFRTWLYQIARNLYYDDLKKRKAVKDQFVDVDQLKDHYHSSEEEEQVEKERLLHQAMSKLPDDKREILILSKFQGLKYQEIAAMTNSSESAVKVRVHRAINSLKNLYFQET